MKNPAVPWTLRKRLQKLRPASMPELGPLVGEARIHLEPGGVDDCLRLVRVDRADRVHDRAPRSHALRRCLQQLELELGERLGAPAKVGATIEDAEPGTRSIDERAVESRQLGGKRAAVRDDDTDVRRAEAARRLVQLTRAGFVDLDRSDVARQHRRLPPWRRAQVERALAVLRADDEPDQLRRRALRPDPAFRERGLVDPVDVPRAGNVGVGRAGDLAAHETDGRLPRLVEGAHELESVDRAEVAPPCLGNPVRIGVLQRGLGRRPFRESVEKRCDPLSDAAEHGVRERDGTFETGATDELDRFVDRRVAGDAVDEPELVGAQSERCPDGRIEAAHGPAAERLDRVVERSHALDRAERQPLRERAIALVEGCRRRSKSTIRVRLVLEHAQEDVERRDAGRAYGRSPRSHASYAIRRPPSG